MIFLRFAIATARLAAVLAGRGALALAGALWLASAQAAGYAVQDDTGQRVAFDAPPQRIVSLLPSLTETVCALDACQRLVAVDRYSNWPEGIAALPRVGGGLDPNIEAIVALKPDLVLLAASSRAALRLRALGLKVLALEPHTGADVGRVARVLARALQVDGADALMQRISDQATQAARSMPASARGRTVYFEVAPGPYVAGQDSFIGQMLRQLGLVNIIAADLGSFPKINPEMVVRAAPDFIMLSQHGATDLASRPGWNTLAAIRDGRVCIFNAHERDILIRPGPRMGEATRLIAQCVTRHLAGQPAASPASLPATGLQ
ncbi:MAG: helical backbone metal receptor [Burkholderiaceae bacterium]|jgi:iron complex transport system substrate-binding protein|nr:helical backbone metal receptor [Burkholderiaceae bacterium]